MLLKIEQNLKIGLCNSFLLIGEMAEWLKAHAWKACKGATFSWVRIPFSPPLKFYFIII